MFEIINIALGGILGVICDLYIIGKINGNKFKFSLINIALAIFVAVATPLTFFVTNGAIRLFVMLVINIFAYRKIFDLSVSRAIISSIVSLITSVVAEMVFTAIAVGCFRLSVEELQTVVKGSTVANVSVYLIAAGIITIKPLCLFISNIINWYDKKKKLKSLLLLLLITVTIWMVAYVNITKQFDAISYLMTIILTVCLSTLALTLFKEKMINDKNTIQYEQLKDYVHTYEALLEDLKENQHEYRNKLNTIKGLVDEKNIRLIEYISDELDEVPQIRYNWIVKLKNITDGGLKGLFYSKVMLMEDLDIQFNLDVSQTIKNNKKIQNMSIEHYKDLCTIVGVYLDNAIDAVKQLENPQILVEFFFMKNKLQIIITNNYEGIIDLNKIDKAGFSTKGKGHGYGLSLTSKIISKNKIYKQHRELTDEFYIQYFEIDLND